MAYPSMTLYSMLRCSGFSYNSYIYRNKTEMYRLRIEEKGTNKGVKGDTLWQDEWVHSRCVQAFSLFAFFEEECSLLWCHGLVTLLQSFSLLRSAIVAAQSAIGLLILPWWKVKCLSLNYFPIVCFI